MENLGGNLKNRAVSIRIRTWTLTVIILIALVFYLLLSVAFKQFNLVDFVVLCALQITIYTIYFPDGELFGTKGDTFIKNKNSYNAKATAINTNKQIGKLREYCKYEFVERKKSYTEMVYSRIGLTGEEFNILKKKSINEIKKLKILEINGSLIHFTKHKRKCLISLLYKDLPVIPNTAETVMSAVENDGYSELKDTSKRFKVWYYAKKMFNVIIVGAVLAYIGYTAKDGIGLAEIAKMATYLATMFTTAVNAYSNGETCSKVYRNRFYVDLSNYIDSFNEWLS